ncbi:MAG: hypothetical protein Q7R35_08605 [Elusimicrobiota bacterium]|nr:hypothetical protein [Elusimicrobiota bacterium]
MEKLIKTLSKLDRPRVYTGLLSLLTAVALTHSVLASWKIYRHEPLREAASRSLMAVNSSFFYDSGMAEPLPVFALKLAMAAGADPDSALRAEGLAVFAAVVLLTIFVLRARYGGLCAAVAALFMAANPYMCFYAMQGGSHLYSLFFLLLFWHYFDYQRPPSQFPHGIGYFGDGNIPDRGRSLPLPEEPSRKAALLAGLYGGLACLSRLDAAWALLIIAGLSWAVRRENFRLKAAGLSLGLAFVLALPYAVYQRAQYGNSLYAQELNLRRWANVDKYAYGSWVGAPSGPLGVPAFIFREGPAGAARGAFSGLGRSLAYELPRTLYYKFLLVPVFLGVYAAFVFKKDRLLFFLAAALLPALPLAAIKQVPATGGIELRYYLCSLWALCALAGLGLQETLAWAGGGMEKWAAEKNAAFEGAGKNNKPKDGF